MYWNQCYYTAYGVKTQIGAADFVWYSYINPMNKPRPGGEAGARFGTFNSFYTKKRVNQPFSFILAKHSLQ